MVRLADVLKTCTKLFIRNNLLQCELLINAKIRNAVDELLNGGRACSGDPMSETKATRVPTKQQVDRHFQEAGSTTGRSTSWLGLHHSPCSVWVCAKDNTHFERGADLTRATSGRPQSWSLKTDNKGLQQQPWAVS